MEYTTTTAIKYTLDEALEFIFSKDDGLDDEYTAEEWAGIQSALKGHPTEYYEALDKAVARDEALAEALAEAEKNKPRTMEIGDKFDICGIPLTYVGDGLCRDDKNKILGEDLEEVGIQTGDGTIILYKNMEWDGRQ